MLVPFQLHTPNGRPRRRADRLVGLGSQGLAQIVGTALDLSRYECRSNYFGLSRLEPYSQLLIGM